MLPDVHCMLTTGTYVRQRSSSSVATWARTALLRRRKRSDLHGTPLPFTCLFVHSASKGTENVASSATEKSVKLLKESY